MNQADFSAAGIRQLLLDRNKAIFKKIDDFKNQVLTGKIKMPQDSVAKTISKMKTDDDTGPIVLIKAYKTATYGNFVDILDEMNICQVARYTFVEIAFYENTMVERAAGLPVTATTPAAPAKK
jgi:biopolymer transport protein ExbD